MAAGKARRRGDELLAMIRLDVVAFDLMELPPIRYEAFMKTFGATNTMQAISQTGEDNLQEEVQTDPVETAEMWTQKPPAAVDLKGLGRMSVPLQDFEGEIALTEVYRDDIVCTLKVHFIENLHHFSNFGQCFMISIATSTGPILGWRPRAVAAEHSRRRRSSLEDFSFFRQILGVLHQVRFGEALQVFGGGCARHFDAAGGGVVGRGPRRPGNFQYLPVNYSAVYYI